MSLLDFFFENSFAYFRLMKKALERNYIDELKIFMLGGILDNVSRDDDPMNSIIANKYLPLLDF